MAAMRRSLSSCLDATRMWRNTERVSLEKNPSMRLSQEPCVGVKVNSKRPAGCCASQAYHRQLDCSPPCCHDPILVPPISNEESPNTLPVPRMPNSPRMPSSWNRSSRRAVGARLQHALLHDL